ncbi:hypothetical protein D3C75_1205500 [compost metagenome]
MRQVEGHEFPDSILVLRRFAHRQPERHQAGMLTVTLHAFWKRYSLELRIIAAERLLMGTG